MVLLVYLPVTCEDMWWKYFQEARNILHRSIHSALWVSEEPPAIICNRGRLPFRQLRGKEKKDGSEFHLSRLNSRPSAVPSSSSGLARRRRIPWIIDTRRTPTDFPPRGRAKTKMQNTNTSQTCTKPAIPKDLWSLLSCPFGKKI